LGGVRVQNKDPLNRHSCDDDNGTLDLDSVIGSPPPLRLNFFEIGIEEVK